MQFFDSHAHMSGEALFDERAALLHNAEKSSVSKIINIATDPLSLKKGLDLIRDYPGLVHNTAAITPHDAATLGNEYFQAIKEAAAHRHLVAIGETGLDYHYMPASKEIQKDTFIRHLHLALECFLPVVIHCREAFHDLFEILDAEYIPHPHALPGIMHCFTGTLEEAHRSIDRNWFVSFSGILTFKKSESLKTAAQGVPLNNLLIETDAPYLSPDPLRGKRNEPAHIVHTARCLADLKQISLEEMANITWNNGHRAFKISRDT